jgi:hypothetical protein
VTPEPRKLEDASFRELSEALLRLIGFPEKFKGSVTLNYDGNGAKTFSYQGAGQAPETASIPRRGGVR